MTTSQRAGKWTYVHSSVASMSSVYELLQALPSKLEVPCQELLQAIETISLPIGSTVAKDLVAHRTCIKSCLDKMQRATRALLDKPKVVEATRGKPESQIVCDTDPAVAERAERRRMERDLARLKEMLGSARAD